MPSSSNPNRFDETQFDEEAKREAIRDAAAFQGSPSRLPWPPAPSQFDVIPTPPRFEHLIAEYNRTPGGWPNRVNFIEWLNQHGRDGWQLVSVVPRHSSLYECFFVRPL